MVWCPPVKVKYLLVRPSTPLSEDIRGRVGERASRTAGVAVGEEELTVTRGGREYYCPSASVRLVWPFSTGSFDFD